MIRNVLATVAAAGLVFAPIAAQAGTRANDSRVSLSPVASVDRISSPVTSAQRQADEEGIPLWLLVLLFGATGAGIIALVESGEGSKSPGT